MKFSPSDHLLHKKIFKTTSTDAIPTTGISDMNITRMLSLERNANELIDPFVKVDPFKFCFILKNAYV